MLIDRIREQSNVEWKVQFEAVVMYMRMGLFDQAETIVREALDMYSAKGRLWALLIQIQHQRASSTSDFERAHDTFRLAINEISKSGEVWCEGARIYLSDCEANPFYNVDEGIKYLDFAIKFTP